MSGMSELTALIAILCLLSGVAIGWYLRRINAWCPHCGDVLTFPMCGGRPTWSAPGRTRPPAH
jgi:hypothetical protein